MRVNAVFKRKNTMCYRAKIPPIEKIIRKNRPILAKKISKNRQKGREKAFFSKFH